jgi:hypothetical protein
VPALAQTPPPDGTPTRVRGTVEKLDDHNSPYGFGRRHLRATSRSAVADKAAALTPRFEHRDIGPLPFETTYFAGLLKAGMPEQ